ncbi:hypothetical protein BDV98DRAFT_579200 [Pterulicium gracile]|uniref:Uncharacterized protein n=1 Tax=Pterulicium gracile TaxID=1884261 RepID=A0A5C3R0J8_9AGAR|nr:hypothetical protein BDV98DRAFT_579200 [Pterula gracilis]
MNLLLDGQTTNPPVPCDSRFQADRSRPGPLLVPSGDCSSHPQVHKTLASPKDDAPCVVFSNGELGTVRLDSIYALRLMRAAQTSFSILPRPSLTLGRVSLPASGNLLLRKDHGEEGKQGASRHLLQAFQLTADISSSFPGSTPPGSRPLLIHARKGKGRARPPALCDDVLLLIFTHYFEFQDDYLHREWGELCDADYSKLNTWAPWNFAAVDRSWRRPMALQKTLTQKTPNQRIPTQKISIDFVAISCSTSSFIVKALIAELHRWEHLTYHSSDGA